MKKIIFFSIFLIFSINDGAFATNKDCNELKKLSLEYLKCKGKIVKDKTITKGENIIKETKDYQDKEWSKEKEKLEKVKEKINETKEKVLN